MKLKPQKRIIDDIGRDLFAPILKTGKLFAGWEVVGWDAEQGFSLTIGRRGTMILIEFEPYNEQHECYTRTDVFNVCARNPFDASRPLSPAEKKLVAWVVQVVRWREKRLPSFERPTTARKNLVREILVDRLLIPEGQNHYYINPYVGCMIGCEFCYVIDRADMSRRWEGLPKVPWGCYLDVKINAPEVLAKEIQRYKPGMVRMSPILTDPYQSVERHYRLTRQCLETLVGTEFSPVILTRGARVVEDIDLLKRFPNPMVGMTIPTDDDHYRQIFEPGADPIEERIAALERCHKAGIHTFACIQPLLPVNRDRLVKLIAPLVKAVRVDRMHEMNRVGYLYEKHDLGFAAQAEFFTENVSALKDAFQKRGITIHELDDMEDLLQVCLAS